MNKLLSIASLAALAVSAPALAQETEKTEFPSPNAIVDAAPASNWVKMAPSDLLVMDLAPDAEGNARRVVIQLMPAPFSQGWIRNIRKLAAAHWWDGTSINRVQDNYVVQWGDASEKKALPEGLETVPQSDYVISMDAFLEFVLGDQQKPGSISAEDAAMAAMEAASGAADAMATPTTVPIWGDRDSYGELVQFHWGWPTAITSDDQIFPIHCYGAIGVGRNYSPDTGSGAELYTVIGHAPRHLDRNIAVVGRVIEGIEHLSSLPRGKGQLGFYEDASKRVPIRTIRLGDALNEDPAPTFEYLNTESEVFAKYADARANRRDPFFIKPAGGADICNIPVPVRRIKGE